MSTAFELEGFEPISRLGGGGFGDVWLARQTNVDRQVAIKVGHSAIQDETIRLRFDRECKALGRLSGHANIVDVYTAGSLNDGRPYLVLEYISGGTLWQRLKKSAIPEEELRAIGAQLSAALAEAHTSGVLHRDLKPENILMRSTGEAVLGDFGIARLHDGANTTSAAITASVAYAAPEILSGKRATVASDLYGVGVCLLASVFRSVPFVQKTDESIHPIINRVLSDRPPDVRRHGVSDELASIIDALLSKDPGKRPASAAELVNQFEALGALAPVQPPTPTATPANAGATQIVQPAPAPAANQAPAPPSGPIPAAPKAPTGGGPLAQPAAAPRPQDAAPGLHNPQASPAWAAAQSNPVTQNPLAQHAQHQVSGGLGAAPAIAAQRVTKAPSGNMKMFALAYVATLVVGGLLLFAASRFIGGDDDQVGETGAAVVDDAPTGPQAEQPLNDPGPTVAGSASESLALTIPLALADTSFGEDASISDESPGPGAGTLCDNVPDTTGLVEWKGQVMTTDLGLRTLYQVVSRFETVEQAATYLDAYAATNDCESWLVTTDEADTSDVVYAALQTPPPAYGDQSRLFEITGELDSVVSLHAKVLLIQSGTDVLSLSLTAISEDQVDELDELATVAVDRLGYAG